MISGGVSRWKSCSFFKCSLREMKNNPDHKRGTSTRRMAQVTNYIVCLFSKCFFSYVSYPHITEWMHQLHKTLR